MGHKSAGRASRHLLMETLLLATNTFLYLGGCATRFGRHEDGAGLDWQGGRRIGTGGAGEEDNAAGQDSVTSVVGQDLSA